MFCLIKKVIDYALEASFEIERKNVINSMAEIIKKFNSIGFTDAVFLFRKAPPLVVYYFCQKWCFLYLPIFLNLIRLTVLIQS